MKLIGLKIINVREATEEELETARLDEAAIAVELSDGTVLLPLADAEGNSPGHLIRVDAARDTVTDVVLR